MLLASTRPSAINAVFTSAVFTPADVFSTAFSVSFCAPLTVLAHPPASVAASTQAHKPIMVLLTFFLPGGARHTLLLLVSTGDAMFRSAPVVVFSLCASPDELSRGPNYRVREESDL